VLWRALAPGGRLIAVLRRRGGLWFHDESYVIGRRRR